MTQASLADRFWHDMGSLYQMPGIQDLCLDLQDGHDVDIPLLLFLLLADRDGLSCGDDALAGFLSGAAEWREQVIRPLRAIRRDMKSRCRTQAEISLREDIKRIELKAERQHLERLASSFAPAPPAGQLTGSVCLTLRYLAERGLPANEASTRLAVLADALTASGRQTANDRSGIQSERERSR